MTEPDLSIQTRLLLAVQGALLGAVPATLRAVTCDAEGSEIRVQYVFDGVIGADDHESASIASAEIIADFPPPWKIHEEVVQLDYPADVRINALRLLAYKRKEKYSEGRPFQTSAYSQSITQARLWGMIFILFYTYYIWSQASTLLVILGFLCFFISAWLIYDERCANCSLVVWVRHPEKKIEFPLWGPFWIPRNCRRCGHKHR